MILLLVNILHTVGFFGGPSSPPRSRGWTRRTPKADELRVARSRKKPPWVRREVIRLKALMPEASCRKLADTFCLLYEHARAMTVGKSYVHGVVRDHALEILRKRREIRRRKPGISARN